jgi:hypothetical protein
VVALDEQGGLVDLLPCGQLSGMVPRSGRPGGPQSPYGPSTVTSSSESILQDPKKVHSQPGPWYEAHQWRFATSTWICDVSTQGLNRLLIVRGPLLACSPSTK